jgi:ABC-2 type transport system ATP-binding protein
VRVIFKQVSFSYRRRRVLTEVDWSIGTGVTGLLGPNGAGKTTLLSLLVTLAVPNSGKIAIGDCDMSTAMGRAAARKYLGFLPQRFSLAPEMKVRDTVAYAAWMNGLAEKVCIPAADRALAAVALSDEASKRVRTLSGGQRQRVGLAAALAHDPAVLVLDEPTVGLDPGQRLRLRQTIADISSERTVIVSSHLLEDISHLCSKVGILAEGKKVFDGTVPELMTLVDDADSGGSRLGSQFERAYDALVTGLGDATC